MTNQDIIDRAVAIVREELDKHISRRIVINPRTGEPVDAEVAKIEAALTSHLQKAATHPEPERFRVRVERTDLTADPTIYWYVEDLRSGRRYNDPASLWAVLCP